MTELAKRLRHVEALIRNKADFMNVAESPDGGWRAPSEEHPTGRWALPMAIWDAVGWEEEDVRELKRVIAAKLPLSVRWIRLMGWCPPLWYVGHETALKAVRAALRDAEEGGE